MKNFPKKNVYSIAAALAVLAASAIAIIYFKSDPKLLSGDIVVKKSDITEIVKSDGTVKPVQSVDLAFQNGGKIGAVSVQVGDYVSAGRPLVGLDSADLNAQLAKSQADLSAQESILDKSKIDLGNLYGDIPNVLSDAYTKANDAVNNQADNLFTNGESNHPLLNFLTIDSQAQTDSQNGRLLSQTELDNWRRELDTLNNLSPDGQYQSLKNAKNYLFEIQNFLISLTSAVNKIYNSSQTTVNADKTYVSAASAEINAAVNNITNKKQAIDSQNAAVASQESNVDAYKSAVLNIKAQLEKNVILSPINGVVSRQDAKAGQIVGPNAVLVSVISSSQYEVESYVSEADVAKIKSGDEADITLDAYGGAVFGARVANIDPAALMTNGVPAYKVTAIFDKADGRIKDGMSANVSIVTAKRENVAAIPARAIINKNGEKFVLVDTGGSNPEERKIGVGISGDDGMTEVVSGLEAGEKIISFGGM